MRRRPVTQITTMLRKYKNRLSWQAVHPRRNSLGIFLSNIVTLYLPFARLSSSPLPQGDGCDGVVYQRRVTRSVEAEDLVAFEGEQARRCFWLMGRDEMWWVGVARVAGRDSSLGSVWFCCRYLCRGVKYPFCGSFKFSLHAAPRMA